MRETDAFAMRMERDPLLRSNITAVALLDTTPDWDLLRARVERTTHEVPSLRQRIAPSPLGFGAPRWEPVDEVDLEWHLRRVGVPPPRTLDAVLGMAGADATSAFDPARPLWSITLVDGLEDGTAAVVIKVHHALTDGVGGIQMAGHLVDLERHPTDGESGSSPLASPPSGATGMADAARDEVDRWAGIAGSLVRALPRAASQAVRHPAGTTTSVISTAQSVARLVRPITTTMSPLMTQRRLARHFGRLDVDMDDLRAAGRAAGGTVNDAYLAGIAGGLRRYHESHGLPVERLRVTLPISLRRDGDPEGGNRLTLARAEIPVAIVDPSERIRAVHAIVMGLRQEPSLRYTEAVAGALNLLPPALTGGMLKHIDLVTANVPGFPDPVFLAGARIEALYPYAPAIGAAVNVALMSYRGTGHVGVTTDAGAVPDPTTFLRCLTEGFDEIVAV